MGNKQVAFSIALLMLVTLNVGSLFCQGVIIDDENIENWSDHAKLDSQIVVKGDYSIKWENISENETMTCYAVPDTMGFKNTLSFWMYCDNPTQAQVSVFLQTSDNEDITAYPNDGYWVWFKLDWHGWKKWEFTGAHFHPAKAATYSHDSYHTIIKDVKMLRFDTDNDSGYGTMGRISWIEGKNANADGRRENVTLYIDDIRWNNEPVWKQVNRPHPGGLITGEMINNAREGYNSGNSSYISAIEDLGKYASRSYDKIINFPQFAADCGTPDSYGYNIRVEFGDDEHIGMLGWDAENALRCAMAYALDLNDPFPNTNLTRDDFRDKALDILNQWALVRKYSGYNEDDNPAGGLELSSRGSKLFLAAELMWDCPEWTQAEKDRFLYFATEAAWHTLSTVIYRSMSNWGWQAMHTMFLINHLADRSHEYDLMHFKNLLNIAICGPLDGNSFAGGQDKIFNTGGLPKEIERGFQSIHYTGWALRGGAGACEIIAHDMGLNLYDWISLNGEGSLRNALVDFYWQYGRNNDTEHTWINYPETQSQDHLEYDLVEAMGYIFENQDMLNYNSYSMAFGGLGFLGVHVFRPHSLTAQSLIVPDSNHATIKTPYIQYKLTTESKNGTITPSSGTYTNGTEIELVAFPDEGYVFQKWQGDTTSTDNPLTISIDSNIHVTANFVAQLDNVKELQPRGYLPNFFQKIKYKDTVRIAYIGGSITQHEGWRVQSFNWFKNQYPGVPFEQINATIGGTTSRLAAFRYELDVLQNEPDLVFVEFAVNDDLVLTDEESKKGMEGLVRKTRLFDPGIDLCFVYTIRSSMLNDLKNERLPEKYKLMEEIAGYYGIPSVNFGDTIAEMHNDGQLVFTGDLPSNPLDLPIVFSSDGVHPHIESGHVLYTESIIRSMKLLRDSFGVINHSFPTVPLMKNNYEDTRLVPVTPEMQQGKWEDVTQRYEDIISQYACKTPLPTWKTTSPGSSVSFEFNGSLIGIYDIKARDAGTIKVSIDEGPWKEYNMYVDGTIQRPILFEDNLGNSLHHIRIEFSENSASGQAWYASSFIIRDDGTTYIDPDREKAGNGSFTYPFNSWNEVEWKTGHTYLQKRGTIAREQIIIGASGSKEQYLRMGAYGTGDHPGIEYSFPDTLYDKETGTIKTDSFREFIHIKDLEIVTLEFGRGINFNHSGSNLILEDLKTGPTGSHGIYLHDWDSVIIRNCELHHAGTQSLWTSADNLHLENCHRYLVEYCRSYDCMQNAPFDASDGGSGYTSGTFQYNYASGRSSEHTWAHYKMSGQHQQSEVTLLYNISNGNTGGCGIALQENCHATAIGNTIYNCRYGFQQKGRNNTVKNNIVHTAQAAIRYETQPAAYDHNIWHNTEVFAREPVDSDPANDRVKYNTLADWQKDSNLCFGQHSLSADPLFKSPGSGDFSLLSGSPAIDAGEKLDSAFQMGLDSASVWSGKISLLNQNRFGSGWEIGAFVNVASFRVNTIHTNGTIQPPGGEFREGDTVSFTAIPDENHVFDGWNMDTSFKTNPVKLVVTSDTTLYASFSKIFKLDVSVINGQISPASGYYREGTQLSIEATPNDGFEFWGWKGDTSGLANPIHIIMDTSKYYQAVFEQIQFFLETYAENGTITPGNGYYNQNEALTLIAVPFEGYEFSHWMGDAAGNSNPLAITMDTNKQVTAVFNILTGSESNGESSKKALRTIRVFPNPFNELLIIYCSGQNNMDNVKYELYDVMGKKIDSGKCTLSKPLDMGHLDQGVYFLKTYLNGVSHQQKIIKQY